MRPSARLSDAVDLGALVDIISNMAGMMILMACITLLIQPEKDATDASPDVVKPISFPMAYLPTDKRSITLCMRYGEFYELPDRELLETVVTHTSKEGTPMRSVTLEKNGVHSELRITNTATGYRFSFSLIDGGGIDLQDNQALTNKIDDIMKRYPPDDFFYVFHTWPDEFESFREVREYMHGLGCEIGWMPHTESRPPTGLNPNARQVDLAYSIGEYAENLTSIKAN